VGNAQQIMIDDKSSQATRSTPPIVFGERLAGSEVFKSLFREGMALVEETANYLDGDGREESRRLGRAGSLSYTTESMRLTTRLMQLASWLLLQRAVNDGEISSERAGAERAKVKLTGISTSSGGPGWDDLPARLKDLVERSVRLQERIRRLDTAIGGSEAGELSENPVARQIGVLTAAFGTAGK
jgi:regulator of CtrA degradation